MTLNLDQIKAPIAEEMKQFEVKFYRAMRSHVPLLDRIMTYIVKRKGKQMRPMFVFLSAGVCGKITEETYRGANLVELLHTATLIHDDIVDDAYERRGFFSINALWKNKIAVLVGDYLLSKGLILSLDHDDFDMLKIVSGAVKMMSEGELLQIEKSRTLNIKEEIYFDIIRMKTASLIASCCSIGAASNYKPKEEIEKMRLFGEKTGIAFQIKDDLFDFGEEKIGKPTGIDIKEKKMTLPLIYTLNNVSKSTKSNLINIVKNHNTDKTKVSELISIVHDSGGIKYAQDKMVKYRDEAFEILDSFPDNVYRQSMEALVDYTTMRKK